MKNNQMFPSSNGLEVTCLEYFSLEMLKVVCQQEKYQAFSTERQCQKAIAIAKELIKQLNQAENE